MNSTEQTQVDFAGVTLILPSVGIISDRKNMVLRLCWHMDGKRLEPGFELDQIKNTTHIDRLTGQMHTLQ